MMNVLWLVGLCTLCFFIASSLTGRFWRYALGHGLLDAPNHRSSHTVATPRGGGVAIAVTTLAAVVLLAIVDVLEEDIVLAICGGGAFVSIVGLVDDFGHVRARWRIVGHFVAAGWVLYWLRGFPSLFPNYPSIFPVWVNTIAGLLFIVWLVNLTNFMDGIDGIAAVEVITVCLGGAAIYLVTNQDGGSWILPLVLASATAGFLVWNWPPAKIFMGDSGSGFLGVALATLSLQVGWVSPRMFWSWLILLGVFFVDATVTLVRRVLRGEKFYQAHRNHGYQHAAIRWGSHRSVTMMVGAINLFWLAPVALLTANGDLDGRAAIAIAYLPLAGLVVFLGAGAEAPTVE